MVSDGHLKQIEIVTMESKLHFYLYIFPQENDYEEIFRRETRK